MITLNLNIFVADFTAVEDAFGTFKSRVLIGLRQAFGLITRALYKSISLKEFFSRRGPPVLQLKGENKNQG